jgi:hypothetical protein
MYILFIYVKNYIYQRCKVIQNWIPQWTNTTVSIIVDAMENAFFWFQIFPFRNVQEHFSRCHITIFKMQELHGSYT